MSGHSKWATIKPDFQYIVHPSGTTGFVVVYAVLAVSVALDSVSLVRASRQLRAEETHLRRDFVDQIMLTSDPTVRAVFAEDAAAIAGDLIAIAGSAPAGLVPALV